MNSLTMLTTEQINQVILQECEMEEIDDHMEVDDGVEDMEVDDGVEDMEVDYIIEDVEMTVRNSATPLFLDLWPSSNHELFKFLNEYKYLQNNKQYQ